MSDDDRTDRIEPTLSVPQGERRPARTPTAEEEVLKRLDRFIDGLGGNFGALTRDLRDSGFGPYALGAAKELYEHFVAAVEGTRRTSSAVHPWEEMRSLAERLVLDGDEAAAAEILEGLAKRSARHALPGEFRARLESDRKAIQERIGEREEGSAPILMPELKPASRMPEFSAGPRSVSPAERSAGNRRLGLAAAGFVAAVALAVGGNYALMTFGSGAAPFGAATEGTQTVAAAATPDQKSPPAGADQGKTNRDTSQAAGNAEAGKAEAAKTGPVHFDAANSAPAREATQGSVVANAGTQPGERPPAVGNPPPAAETARTMPPPNEALEMNAAGRVQKRLAELGYLTGSVDGVWGPRSRQALRDFKLTNNLPPDETLDARTRTALFSVNARIAGSRGAVEANTAANAGVIGAPPQAGGEGVAARADDQDMPVVADAAPEEPAEADWDEASQQAFNDFNALVNAERYVVGSERLRGAGLGGGDGSIVGTWGRGAASCTVGEEPSRDMLWISRQTVSGAGRSCEVVDVRRSGANWLVIGRCNNGPTAYRFAVHGDRMVEFASGGTVYRRCEVRRPGISAAYYDRPTPPEEIGSNVYGPREYVGPRDYVAPPPYGARDMTPPRDVGGGVSVGAGGAGVSVGGGSSVIVLPRR